MSRCNFFQKEAIKEQSDSILFDKRTWKELDKYG